MDENVRRREAEARETHDAVERDKTVLEALAATTDQHAVGAAAAITSADVEHVTALLDGDENTRLELELAMAQTRERIEKALREDATDETRKSLGESEERLSWMSREVETIRRRIADAKAQLASTQDSLDRAAATAKLRELQREQREMKKKSKTR